MNCRHTERLLSHKVPADYYKLSLATNSRARSLQQNTLCTAVLCDKWFSLCFNRSPSTITRQKRGSVASPIPNCWGPLKTRDLIPRLEKVRRTPVQEAKVFLSLYGYLAKPPDLTITPYRYHYHKARNKVQLLQTVHLRTFSSGKWFLILGNASSRPVGRTPPCYTMKLFSWHCNAIQVSPIKITSCTTAGFVPETFSRKVEQHPTRATALRLSYNRAKCFSSVPCHDAIASWNVLEQVLRKSLIV